MYSRENRPLYLFSALWKQLLRCGLTHLHWPGAFFAPEKPRPTSRVGYPVSPDGVCDKFTKLDTYVTEPPNRPYRTFSGGFCTKVTVLNSPIFNSRRPHLRNPHRLRPVGTKEIRHSSCGVRRYAVWTLGMVANERRKGSLESAYDVQSHTLQKIQETLGTRNQNFHN